MATPTLTKRPRRFSFTILNASLMPDLTGYLSVPDAAQKLDFHVEHVRRLLRQKELTGKKVGYMWFVSEESIKEYSETKSRKAQTQNKE